MSSGSFDCWSDLLVGRESCSQDLYNSGLGQLCIFESFYACLNRANRDPAPSTRQLNLHVS